MKTVDVTALIDVLAAGGKPPFKHFNPEMGFELLNRLAEVLDLPMDCSGVDIHIHCNDAVRVVVHRHLQRLATSTAEPKS